MGHEKDHVDHPQSEYPCDEVLFAYRVPFSRDGVALMLLTSCSPRFIVDPTSPEYQSDDDDEWVDEGDDEDQEEYDYEILSKSLAAPKM